MKIRLSERWRKERSGSGSRGLLAGRLSAGALSLSLSLLLGGALLATGCSDDDNGNDNNNNQVDPALCGNGELDGNEACDDGNESNADGCLTACTGDDDCCVLNVCGDGYVDETDDGTGPVEACDDGNESNADGCLTACDGAADCCVANVCGDGYVNETDDGSGPAEVCDDGNTVGGDECAADCSQDLSLCGNGILDAGEECDATAVGCGDLGFDGGSLSCDASCMADTSGCTTCGDGVCDAGETPTLCSADCQATRKVDLLIVMDNSGTMIEEQAKIQDRLSDLESALRGSGLALPDIHIGVVSTDLGAGGFNLHTCNNPPEGDDGTLLVPAGCGLGGGLNYVVDVEPTGCTIQRDGTGQCTSHDCTQQDCADGTLGQDSLTGCPRCRNWGGTTLADSVSCLVGLGGQGCGFEQPLEAMRLALDNHPDNSGFFRPDALLAVLLVTDEDDCSASDTGLFDPDDSSLGPINSFRCFQYGVSCDINDPTHTGVRHQCEPLTGPQAMLYEVNEYVSFLHGIKDPGRIVVAAIAGPFSGDVTVVEDTQMGWLEVDPSCSVNDGSATPGVRLKSFVQTLMPPAEMGWAYGSICATSYGPYLLGLGDKLRVMMQ